MKAQSWTSEGMDRTLLKIVIALGRGGGSSYTPGLDGSGWNGPSHYTFHWTIECFVHVPRGPWLIALLVDSRFKVHF